jgi:hypothetical protein
MLEPELLQLLRSNPVDIIELKAEEDTAVRPAAKRKAKPTPRKETKRPKLVGKQPKPHDRVWTHDPKKGWNCKEVLRKHETKRYFWYLADGTAKKLQPDKWGLSGGAEWCFAEEFDGAQPIGSIGIGTAVRSFVKRGKHKGEVFGRVIETVGDPVRFTVEYEHGKTEELLEHEILPMVVQNSSPRPAAAAQPAKQPVKQPAKQPTKQPARQPAKQPAKKIKKQPAAPIVKTKPQPILQDRQNNDPGFQQEARVEVNWRNSGEWYAGKISRAYMQGSGAAAIRMYDILFDDGDREESVPAIRITLLRPQRSAKRAPDRDYDSIEKAGAMSVNPYKGKSGSKRGPGGEGPVPVSPTQSSKVTEPTIKASKTSIAKPSQSKPGGSKPSQSKQFAAAEKIGHVLGVGFGEGSNGGRSTGSTNSTSNGGSAGSASPSIIASASKPLLPHKPKKTAPKAKPLSASGAGRGLTKPASKPSGGKKAKSKAKKAKKDKRGKAAEEEEEEVYSRGELVEAWWDEENKWYPAVVVQSYQSPVAGVGHGATTETCLAYDIQYEDDTAEQNLHSSLLRRSTATKLKPWQQKLQQLLANSPVASHLGPQQALQAQLGQAAGINAAAGKAKAAAGKAKAARTAAAGAATTIPDVLPTDSSNGQSQELSPDALPTPVPSGRSPSKYQGIVAAGLTLIGCTVRKSGMTPGSVYVGRVTKLRRNEADGNVYTVEYDSGGSEDLLEANLITLLEAQVARHTWCTHACTHPYAHTHTRRRVHSHAWTHTYTFMRVLRYSHPHPHLSNAAHGQIAD